MHKEPAAARAEMPCPAYDRSRLSQSIVHIGVGGFNRAHQAIYLDDLLQAPALRNAAHDTTHWENAASACCHPTVG